MHFREVGRGYAMLQPTLTGLKTHHQLRSPLVIRSNQLQSKQYCPCGLWCALLSCLGMQGCTSLLLHCPCLSLLGSSCAILFYSDNTLQTGPILQQSLYFAHCFPAFSILCAAPLSAVPLHAQEASWRRGWQQQGRLMLCWLKAAGGAGQPYG
jgi:hypothetical protein